MAFSQHVCVLTFKKTNRIWKVIYDPCNAPKGSIRHILTTLTSTYDIHLIFLDLCYLQTSTSSSYK